MGRGSEVLLGLSTARAQDVVDVETSPVLSAMLRHLALNSLELPEAFCSDSFSDASTGDESNTISGEDRALFKGFFNKAVEADDDFDICDDARNCAFDMVEDEAVPYATALTDLVSSHQCNFDLALAPHQQAVQPVAKQVFEAGFGASQTFSASLAASFAASYVASRPPLPGEGSEDCTRWHELSDLPRISGRQGREETPLDPFGLAHAHRSVMFGGADEFSSQHDTEPIDMDDDFALPPPALDLDEPSMSVCANNFCGEGVQDIFAVPSM